MPRSSQTTSKPTTSKSRVLTVQPRPQTAVTSTGYGFDNEILCAVSESRGISPSVGLAFLNLTTCEAVLCQFTDTQTFARTCHKLKVFSPTEIIFATTATNSKLISIITENLEIDATGIRMFDIDRRHWSERSGLEYLQQLAFPDDYEALRLQLQGNYYAICCFAAALKFLDQGLSHSFLAKSLRIKFEYSEGSMMIDVSTIANLELVQNLRVANSKDCLYGVLNSTSTKMGARLLKNNILQPSTDKDKIEARWRAVQELSSRDELLYRVKEGLAKYVDTDRALASLVLIPKHVTFQHMEQAVNNILMLKSFVSGIRIVWQALSTAVCDELLLIRELLDPCTYSHIEDLIHYTLSPDVAYSQNPVDLRNHRVFAIRAGTNGFLDVARQSYNEFVGDVKLLIEQLQVEHEITLQLKYDIARQFYIQIKTADIDTSAPLPRVFINIFRHRKKIIECQTLDLIKYNQKIKDVHNEIIAMSDASIQSLINRVRPCIQPLFKISEGLALLDLLATFAEHTIRHAFCHPEVTPGVLACRSARHPIRSIIQKERYVPNDTFATADHKRFQIITGCNMSGKSTYIRSIILLCIMAQSGSFVPAEYASFPIFQQCFARISTDDCIEANVSTFANEMREMAFILRNLSSNSLIIIDELGRGTSTTDGLSIAIAIAEALIQSKAMVFFVTHFRELPRILNERAGVFNIHMTVDIDEDFSRMRMRYKVAEGQEQQKYYGLTLAQLMDLPEEVLKIAVTASRHLNDLNDARKSDAKLIGTAKKRKLALHTQETLQQARDAGLHGQALLRYLQNLQREFLVRMSAIDAELVAAERPVTEDWTDQTLSTAGSVSDTRQWCEAERSQHDIVSSVSRQPQISWEASVIHENPLFRPMPTDNNQTNDIKQEATSIDVGSATTDAAWLTERGDKSDEPINIDDDEAHLRQNTSYGKREQESGNGSQRH